MTDRTATSLVQCYIPRVAEFGHLLDKQANLAICGRVYGPKGAVPFVNILF